MFWLPAQLVLLLLCCAQCHIDVDGDNRALEGDDDTTSVGDFNIERENNLVDWTVYDMGPVALAAPNTWKKEMLPEKLVIRPAQRQDSMEGVEFRTFKKGDQALSDDKFANLLAHHSFTDFEIIKSEGFVKTEFKNSSDFFYERHCEVRKGSSEYSASFVLYFTKNDYYQYRLFLSKKMIDEYKGNLANGLLSNVKVNGYYLWDNKRPAFKITNIK